MQTRLLIVASLVSACGAATGLDDVAGGTGSGERFDAGRARDGAGPSGRDGSVDDRDGSVRERDGGGRDAAAPRGIQSTEPDVAADADEIVVAYQDWYPGGDAFAEIYVQPFDAEGREGRPRVRVAGGRLDRDVFGPPAIARWGTGWVLAYYRRAGRTRTDLHHVTLDGADFEVVRDREIAEDVCVQHPSHIHVLPDGSAAQVLWSQTTRRAVLVVVAPGGEVRRGDLPFATPECAVSSAMAPDGTIGIAWSDRTEDGVPVVWFAAIDSRGNRIGPVDTRVSTGGNLDWIVHDGTHWIVFVNAGPATERQLAFRIDRRGVPGSPAAPAIAGARLLGAGPERVIGTIILPGAASVVDWNMREDRFESSVVAFPVPLEGQAAARVGSGGTVAVVGTFALAETMDGFASPETWLAVVRDGRVVAEGRPISPL